MRGVGGHLFIAAGEVAVGFLEGVVFAAGGLAALFKGLNAAVEFLDLLACLGKVALELDVLHGQLHDVLIQRIDLLGLERVVAGELLHALVEGRDLAVLLGDLSAKACNLTA